MAVKRYIAVGMLGLALLANGCGPKPAWLGSNSAAAKQRAARSG